MPDQIPFHPAEVGQSFPCDGEYPTVVRVTVHDNICIWQVHRLAVSLDDSPRNGTATACPMKVFDVQAGSYRLADAEVQLHPPAVTAGNNPTA